MSFLIPFLFYVSFYLSRLPLVRVRQTAVSPSGKQSECSRCDWVTELSLPVSHVMRNILIRTITGIPPPNPAAHLKPVILAYLFLSRALPDSAFHTCNLVVEDKTLTLPWQVTKRFDSSWKQAFTVWIGEEEWWMDNSLVHAHRIGLPWAELIVNRIWILYQSLSVKKSGMQSRHPYKIWCKNN